MGDRVLRTRKPVNYKDSGKGIPSNEVKPAKDTAPKAPVQKKKAAAGARRPQRRRQPIAEQGQGGENEAHTTEADTEPLLDERPATANSNGAVGSGVGKNGTEADDHQLVDDSRKRKPAAGQSAVPEIRRRSNLSETAGSLQHRSKNDGDNEPINISTERAHSHTGEDLSSRGGGVDRDQDDDEVSDEEANASLQGNINRKRKGARLGAAPESKRPRTVEPGQSGTRPVSPHGATGTREQDSNEDVAHRTSHQPETSPRSASDHSTERLGAVSQGAMAGPVSANATSPQAFNVSDSDQDEEAPSTDDTEGVQRRWQRLRGRLNRHELGPDHKRTFNKLENLALKLGSRARAVIPPRRPSTTTFQEYIDGDLRRAVTDAFKEEWEYRLSMPPLADASQRRLADIRELAERICESHNDFILPLEEYRSDDPQVSVAELWRNFKVQRRERLDAAWDRYVSEAHDPADRATRNAQREERSPEGGYPLCTMPAHVQLADLRKRSLGFDGQRVGLSEHWNFEYLLYDTDSAIAELWVKYDEQQRIIDRRVVKSIKFTDELWNHSVSWYRGVPMEHRLRKELKALEDADHIIDGDSECGIYDTRNIVRFYLEFCPHGSLEDLIKRHSEAERRTLRDGSQRGPRIPERALWAFFEALVSAACLMSDGFIPETREDRGPERRLLEIAHCDIKPANIFLAAPNAKPWWPDIPTIRLADFGSADYVPREGGLPYGVGTALYMAPEMIEDPQGLYLEQDRRSAVDVWSIGRVMLSLMKRAPHNQRWQSFDLTTPEDYPAFEEAEDDYSEALCRLVRWALVRNHRRRATPRALWHSIQQEVAMFRGLRQVPWKMARGRADEDPLYYEPDRYRLWTPET